MTKQLVKDYSLQTLFTKGVNNENKKESFTVKVINLIRSLPIEKRRVLAAECNVSVGYLNGLNATDRKPSILLAHKIYKSETNKSLQKGKRFLKEEFIEFVETCMEEDQ